MLLLKLTQQQLWCTVFALCCSCCRLSEPVAGLYLNSGSALAIVAAKHILLLLLRLIHRAVAAVDSSQLSSSSGALCTVYRASAVFAARAADLDYESISHNRCSMPSHLITKVTYERVQLSFWTDAAHGIFICGFC